LATNIPKVPLQKGPPMHPLNSQWKIDPYWYKVHCDARS